MGDIGRNKGGLWSVALLVTCVCASATSGAAGATDDARARGPFRVRLPAGNVAMGVRRALASADQLLAQPACQEVLTDFRDASGRTLKEVLEEKGVSAQGYLRWIVFSDGYDLPACRKSALAVTAPQSRVVFVCPTAFAEIMRGQPEEEATVLIHEMLHTLGLGENPPRSRDITARVRARCRSGKKP